MKKFEIVAICWLISLFGMFLTEYFQFKGNKVIQTLFALMFLGSVLAFVSLMLTNVFKFVTVVTLLPLLEG